MATLTVTQPTDFRGDPAETGINELVFDTTAGSAVTATFATNQFGPALIVNNLVVQGGAGQDHIRVIVPTGTSANFSAAAWSFSNWGADDRVTLIGGSGSFVSIQGTSVADIIVGNGARTNVLQGHAGNDLLKASGSDDPYGKSNRLDGGSGNDTMEGGNVADTYVVDSLLDVIIEAGNSAGDWVESSLDFSLEALPEIENLRLTGAATIGMGSDTDNEMAATLAATLYALGGNDTLSGGTQTTLVGGAGDDVYLVTGTEDGFATVVEGATGGTDRVYVDMGDGAAYQLGADVENMTVIQGEGIAYGNNLDNNIQADTSDTTLAGGNGNDTYDFTSYSRRADIVEEAGEAAGDADLVMIASPFYAMPENVENLYAYLYWDEGFYGARITGSSGDNVIISYTGRDDRFLGGGGNDRLETGEDRDTLNGGAGSDTLIGGNGDDLYLNLDTSDLLIEEANGGFDSIESAVSFSLVPYANVEGLELTGVAAISGEGSGAANRLWGNGSANLLKGLGGADTIYGREGQDTIRGGEGDDFAEGGDGNDVLFGEAGNDELSGRGSNDRINGGDGLDEIDGGQGNDRLSGGAGDDTLSGSNGSDTLDGGEGADTLAGGLGNDLYLNVAQSDVIVEDANGGSDGIESAGPYVLPGSVESLTLTGDAAVRGEGNALANGIVGNRGANLLKGWDANDTILGGVGADTLRGGAGDDDLFGGNDDDNLFGEDNDDSLLGQKGADTLVGGAGDDTLTGNTGNDRLRGDDGADRIQGGAGHDTMDGGAGADLFVFQPVSAGSDRIDGFETAIDRFLIAGGAFTALSESGGSTTLLHQGGRILIAGVAGLSLAEWNALIIAEGGTVLAEEELVAGLAARLASADYFIA